MRIFTSSTTTMRYPKKGYRSRYNIYHLEYGRLNNFYRLPLLLLLYLVSYVIIVSEERNIPMNMMVVAVTTTTSTTTPASTFMRYKYGVSRPNKATKLTSPTTTTTTTTTTTLPPLGIPTIWVYTGTLMDPYTGQRICNVEGIEYIQPISQCSGRVVHFGTTNNNDCNPLPTNNHPSTITSSIDDPSLQLSLPNWFQQYRRRCRPLQIASIIEEYITNSNTHNNDQNDFNRDDTPQQEHLLQSDTMMSRKLFCYTQPTTTTTTNTPHNHQDLNNQISKADYDNDENTMPNLFTCYRKKATNPLGPSTMIPLDQVMTCYDSIISSICMTRCHNNNNDAIIAPDSASSFSSPSSCWILHTEIPSTNVQPTTNTKQLKRSNRSSKCIWSCIDRQSSSNNSLLRNIKDDDIFDFSIFTRRRSVPLSLSSVISDILGIHNPNLNNNSSTTTTNSRKRRQWVQFGGNGRGSSSSRKNELGVRETYQYYNTTTTTINTKQQNEMKVRYTRYGEAPVWYGPGRVCVLELIGTRLQTQPHLASSPRDSVTDMLQQYVPVIPSVISQYIPDFWKVLPTSFTNAPASKPNRSTLRRDQQDENNFLYYAHALHPVLQLQDDDVDGTFAATKTTRTADEYRQYYNDLAIGRQVDQILNPTTMAQSPPQQLLQNLEYERRRNVSTNAHRRQQLIQNFQHNVFSTWDKLRSASTLSLW